MKVNRKYMHAAAVHTAIEFDSIKGLANEVARELHGDVEVYNTHGDGFTLRTKKSVEIDNDQLTAAITKAICSILDDDLENTMDYILENYDFTYNPDRIEEDCIRELFDYNRNGRLIYVEIDMLDM